MTGTFWDRWVWPAGGSGGIPGDVVATLVWVILASIASYVFVPRIRTWVNNHIKGIHEKLEAQHKEKMAQADAHHKEALEQAQQHHEAQLELAKSNHLEHMAALKSANNNSPPATPLAQSTSGTTTGGESSSD
jgi:hypothetical protein